MTAVGLPDLLTAAVAERERVTVLHYDGDYDFIGQITGQPMRSIGRAPSGMLYVAEMQAAFDPYVPGLHQVAADRSGHRVDDAVLARG